MHEWSRRYSRLTRDSPRILGFRRRKRARNVPRRLVLSQPFIDDLPQKSEQRCAVEYGIDGDAEPPPALLIAAVAVTQIGPEAKGLALDEIALPTA